MSKAERKASVEIKLSSGFRLTARLTDEEARQLMHSLPQGPGLQLRRYRP